MAKPTAESGLMRRAVELGTFATPAIVVLTGAIYLAGWAERDAVLHEFGLTGDHFSQPLQATLARGYLLVLIIVPVIVIGLAIFWAVIGGADSDKENSNGAAHGPRALLAFLAPARRWLGKALRVNFYFLAGLLILAGCDIGARRAGSWRASDIKSTVDSGCLLNCSVYVTGERRVIGQIIEADADRMAVYAGGHVVLLANDDVQAVLPYRPSMRLPSPSARGSAIPSPSAPPSR